MTKWKVFMLSASVVITLISLPLLYLETVGSCLNSSVQRECKPDQDLRSYVQDRTVRVLLPDSAGSGVLISRHLSTYYVLTCRHVVELQPDLSNFIIETPEGYTHTARWLPTLTNPDIDIAILEFISDQTYSVIKGVSSATLFQSVVAAGFPNWQWVDSETIASTRTLGSQAFRLEEGEIQMLLDQSLKEGYQMGYTTDVQQGMSGGPIFNYQGELIGINGRLKYPPQGIEVFEYTDGSLPPDEVFKQMEALSWGIPATEFADVVTQLQEKQPVL